MTRHARTMNTTPEWEQRCAALWDAFEEADAEEFRSRTAALTDPV